MTTINIHDYLTKEDVADLVREQARERLRAEGERLIDNGVYFAVRALINELFDADPTLRDDLEERVKEVIADSTKFNLFNRAYAWDKRMGLGDTVGQQILDQAVRDSEPTIRDMVTSTIAELGYRDVKSLVMESISSFWDDQEVDDQ